MVDYPKQLKVQFVDEANNTYVTSELSSEAIAQGIKELSTILLEIIKREEAFLLKEEEPKE